MKLCPECRRHYYDDSLLYCLDDGSALLEGPGDSVSEPATAILSEQTQTRGQMHTTASPPHPDPDLTSESGKSSNVATLGVLAGLSVIAVLLIGGYLGYRFIKGNNGQISSVAVLPFENKSSDSDTDYLSDGLAESLIFRLTQLPNLKVSPASSVMRYKGRETDVAKIASDLGVDAVMTGRFVKRGDNLNITVELVDARDNKSLWGEQYARRMSDLLETQREIAAAIVDKLQVKLAASAPAITKKYTDNSEAYQLYLKGRFYFARRTQADMEKSIGLMQQATTLDPNFALAYVGIAENYASMPSYPYMKPDEAAPKARAAIEKALALDSDLAEAHAVAGMIAMSAGEYSTAEREFKKAVDLGPNLALTHYRYGWVYLSPVGRHDEAISEMKRAMELEPLAVQQGANYASVLLYARRFDEAVEQARKMYELDPEQIGARNWLCYALNAKGLYAEAQKIGEKASLVDPTFSTACLGLAYAKSGQRDKALAVIASVKEQEKRVYSMTYWTAAQYAALGDKNAAFAELETAFRNHDWFLKLLKVDPFMDPLRGDPRFDEMIYRLKLP